MSFFKIRRNIYSRLFSYGDDDSDSDDSDYEDNDTRFENIIVCPNTPTDEPTSSPLSTSTNYFQVDNFSTYMNSQEVKKLLKKSRKIFIFKLQINETSNKLGPADLEALGRSCATNSIVIVLRTRNGKNFFLYWKSKKIKCFLVFKLYSGSSFMNDLKLFEFLGSFLTDSLKREHLGLQSCVSTHPRLNTFELHLFADYRNFNLLLIAAEKGDSYIVNLLLNCNCSTESGGTNAQTLAWNGRHFEVLLMLLKSNLTYPDSFKIDECPNDIKEFHEISQKLNEAMIAKNEQFVLDILSQNTEMRHFYNSDNESAVAFALKRKLFDMYSLLISKNIILGPHEKFTKLKDELKETEKEKLREIHYNESKFLPDNHMHVLLSNSRLGHNTSDAKIKYDTIQKAFEVLNQNPFIQIILMIVAASRNFRIIFDFNRDSVEVVDPTADESIRGQFYLSGRIYIGAKKLMNFEEKFEALGTLAHELCHYAMSLVYENYAKPYSDGDTKSEKLFDEILQGCQKKSGKERLIDLVFDYPPYMYHAELIVRVPHMIMLYLSNPEKLQLVREIFEKLFKVFEEKIFLEMKKALPRIEKNSEIEAEKNKKRIRKLKIISVIIGVLSIISAMVGIYVTRIIFFKPTYKFSTLPYDDKIKVENAPVIYKKVDIQFHDLFPRNSTAYYKLTSDHITQMLDGDPLDLSDEHFLYLDDLVVLGWRNLTEKLKDRFLNSNFTFQKEPLKFEKLHELANETFSSLTSQQIISVLSDENLVIHEMIQNNTDFFMEREIFDEHIYEIYFLYLSTYFWNITSFVCDFQNSTINVKFENFYQNFTSQNFEVQMEKINQISNNETFKNCGTSGLKIINSITNETIDSIFYYEFGFSKMLAEVKSSKIFIFSAESGAGKTTTLRDLTLKIKKEYPVKWVSYIDCRDRQFYTNVSGNFSTDKKLKKIFGLTENNEFESEIFRCFYNAGRVILLWDGYDQIPLDYRNISADLFATIKNSTNNIQFVSTRSLYSDSFRYFYKSQIFTIVPFNEITRSLFLSNFFRVQKIDNKKIPKSIEKAERIITSTNSIEDFNTPLLIRMVADIMSDHPDIFESENLYDIYDKFMDKRIRNWLDNSEFAKEFYDVAIKSGFNINAFIQKGALRSAFFYSYEENFYLTLKLKIMHQKVPKELTSDEVSRMGILYNDKRNNFRIAHETVYEFLIAQYIVENVYNAVDDPSEAEAEMRIQMFYSFLEFENVKNFIFHYFESSAAKNSTNKFDPMIRNVITSKFHNLFYNALLEKTYSVNFLLKFFEKDHELLLNLLKINENVAFYSKTLDFSVSICKSDERKFIKEFGISHLSPAQYEIFTNLNDQKGIILYSMYCIKPFYDDDEFASFDFGGYKLSDDILESNDLLYVFKSIANNLTTSELKILLKSKLILIPINSFVYEIEINNDFYQKIFELSNLNLSKDEQKEWLMTTLETVSFISNQSALSLFLEKYEEIFTDLEIYEIFTTKNILHLIAGTSEIDLNIQAFNTFWTFFINHTNQDQQIAYLKREAAIECYKYELYDYFCYFAPPLTLLHASLFANFERLVSKCLQPFLMIKNIYMEYFNNTELQQLIISSSKNVIPYVITSKTQELCQEYATFLKIIFKGNENLLKTFLNEPVEPTAYNIFDLLEQFNDPQSCIDIFKNLL